MPYEWIRFLHVLAAIAFVAAHGASIFVLYAIRGSRDRQRLLSVLDFSSRTVGATYVSLAAVVGTGLWMGFVRDDLFGRRWYWLSLVLLGVVTILMLVLAKPFTERLRSAMEMRPSGVPRTSDEELRELVRSPRADLISFIGIVGLVAILYLMVFQPDLGAARGVAIPSTTTTPRGTTTLPPGSTTTGLVQTSTTTVVGTSTTLSEEEALLALGREVYEVTAGGIGCAFCHGSDGKGTPYGPNIRGRSRGDIANALNWAGEMTNIDLSERELDAVTLYLSRLP